MESFNIHYLNTFFKSNKDFARYLEKVKNICLPGTRDKGITTAYLLRVARNEVFTVSKDAYKSFQGEIRPVTKTELNTWLSEASGLPTGFEDDALPSKKWLLDSLYSINPKHPIFQDDIQRQDTVPIPGG